MPAPSALDILISRWAAELSPSVRGSELYDLATRYGLIPSLCTGIASDGSPSARIAWGTWLKGQGILSRILEGRKLYICPKPTSPDALVVALLRPDVSDGIASIAQRQGVTREAVISECLAAYWGLDIAD